MFSVCDFNDLPNKHHGWTTVSYDKSRPMRYLHNHTDRCGGPQRCKFCRDELARKRKEAAAVPVNAAVE